MKVLIRMYRLIICLVVIFQPLLVWDKAVHWVLRCIFSNDFPSFAREDNDEKSEHIDRSCLLFADIGATYGGGDSPPPANLYTQLYPLPTNLEIVTKFVLYVNSL